MKTVFVIFLIFPLSLHAQEKSPEAYKFRIGLNLGPETNRIIDRSDNFDNHIISSKMGISGGIILAYSLTERIAIKSGLGYGLKSYNHTEKGINLSLNVNPQIGFVGESQIVSSVRFHEFQIPLIFEFKFNYRLFACIGVEYDYQFNNKSKRTLYYEINKFLPLQTEEASTSNFSTYLSFGDTYIISDQLDIVLEPYFKYYFKSHIFSESNLFNLGLKTTLNLNF